MGKRAQRGEGTSKNVSPSFVLSHTWKKLTPIPATNRAEMRSSSIGERSMSEQMSAASP